MNQKTVILMVAFVAIVPILGFIVLGEYETVPTHNSVDGSYALRSFDEEVQSAHLIIKGNIIDSHTEKIQISSEDKSPVVFTIATVEIDEVLKGKINSKSIEVILWGGESNGFTTESDRMNVKKNNTVVMYLGQEPGHEVFGDRYYLTSEIEGLYLIDKTSNMAQSLNATKHLSYDSLKERIITVAP